MAPKKDAKGKEKMEPRVPTPPPFVIRSAYLGRDFSRLYRWIEKHIESELEYIRSQQDPHLRLPARVNGKLYLPQTMGVFLVTVTHNELSATLLFQLRNLYYMAFNTGRVWYHFKDFDPEELPTQKECPYDNVVELDNDSSYAGVGGCDNVGVCAADYEWFVGELSKAAEYHLLGVLTAKLTQGPSSFPVVTISEATRFWLLRKWMIGTIARRRSSLIVPERFTRYFNSWSTYSVCFTENKPAEDVIVREAKIEVAGDLVSVPTVEKTMISVERLGKMMAVLNKRLIEPIKVNWHVPTKVALKARVKWRTDKRHKKTVGGDDPDPSDDSAVLNPAIKLEKSNLTDSGIAGDDTDPSDDSFFNPAIKLEKSNLTGSSIADLESAKQMLQDDVVSPVIVQHNLREARCNRGQGQRTGISTLLYGPPGSGKTHLAKTFALESAPTLVSISPWDLTGATSENINWVSDIFQLSREDAPSYIFIDEIDSLCGNCGEDIEREASERIKVELVEHTQALAEDGGVHVIAATNKPYALDKTVLQIFERQIYIQLPDMKSRRQMFMALFGKVKHRLSEKDFEEVARKTDGFSYVDINLCVNSVISQVRRASKNAQFFIPVMRKRSREDTKLDYEKDAVAGRDKVIDMWIPCRGEEPGTVRRTVNDLAMNGYSSMIAPLPVEMTDVLEVVAKQLPTVGKDELMQYEQFRQDYREQD